MRFSIWTKITNLNFGTLPARANAPRTALECHSGTRPGARMAGWAAGWLVAWLQVLKSSDNKYKQMITIFGSVLSFFRYWVSDL